mgnify:CR=1 FL=1
MIPTVSSQLLLLVIVYAMLAFLLLCLLLATRWHWGVKLAGVALVAGVLTFLWLRRAAQR